MAVQKFVGCTMTMGESVFPSVIRRQACLSHKTGVSVPFKLMISAAAEAEEAFYASMNAVDKVA